MKNKIYNLIASLASLVLGVILLVCVCLAWYVFNDFAKVEGVNGITSKGAFYDVSLTRYVAIETNVEGQENTYTYTIGNELTNVDQSAILPYDELEVYSKVIYKISFTTTLNRFSLSFKNTSSRTNAVFDKNFKTTSDANFDETSDYYNYLSNVATFSKLKMSGSNLIVDDSDTKKYFCDYSSFSDQVIHEVYIYENQDITISPTQTNEQTITLYLLFDYNKDHINQLFTANLGINKSIFFKEDLQFVLSDIKPVAA